MSAFYGAGDEARTRDILLGKEAFYHCEARTRDILLGKEAFYH